MGVRQSFCNIARHTIGLRIDDYDSVCNLCGKILFGLLSITQRRRDFELGAVGFDGIHFPKLVCMILPEIDQKTGERFRAHVDTSMYTLVLFLTRVRIRVGRRIACRAAASVSPSL